jgi:hypothetical protein
MKQTSNHLNTFSASDSERSSAPRITTNLDNLLFPLPSSAPGFPVGNSFAQQGSRPHSPMTRAQLRTVLQDALDIINDDSDDIDFDSEHTDKQ